MSPAAALVLALVVAGLVVAAMSKPKTLVGGIFQRDRKGRMTLVLTPTPKPKKRRRRK